MVERQRFDPAALAGEGRRSCVGAAVRAWHWLPRIRVEAWLAQAEATPQGNTAHVTPRGNAPGWWGQPPSGNCGPSASIRSVGLLRDRAAVQVPGAKPDEEPSL